MLRYSPPKWQFSLYSNRHNSTPEVDFDPILTAFGNVQGALKRPMKILGQRVQEGVEIENGPYPPNFKPPFLGEKFRDFSEILPSAAGSCLLVSKDIKSKLGSSEKSQGRLK